MGRRRIIAGADCISRPLYDLADDSFSVMMIAFDYRDRWNRLIRAPMGNRGGLSRGIAGAAASAEVPVRQGIRGEG